jgi:GntR family transcriptional regulator/MocR family aminotransferase
LHVLAWLAPDLDEGTVVSAAAAAGIGLAGLAPRRIDPAGPGGLVFGYGAIIEEAIDGGVRRLADIVAEVRTSAS